MTRFPPNVEQVLIDRNSIGATLTARRNDVVLTFPLSGADCRYLAALLLECASSNDGVAS